MKITVQDIAYEVPGFLEEFVLDEIRRHGQLTAEGRAELIAAIEFLSGEEIPCSENESTKHAKQ